MNCIFRTVFFYYSSETSVKDIDTYRFVVPEDYFKSPVDRKENMCYCTKTKEECATDTTAGILDISNCFIANGAPIIMSAPHFSHGSQFLKDRVGLEESGTDMNYGTYLDVEPVIFNYLIQFLLN